MKDIIIDEVLIPSLCKLYEIDYGNILWGVSERNICARLAHHMENIMREYDRVNGVGLFNNYYADVEYNRMGNGVQKYYENREHRPQYMVSDLLIQSRGEERNYLAIEMKRRGNHRHIDEDRERLRSLVSSQPNGSELRCVYDTMVGAFITYSPKDVTIEFFENVNGQGEMTGEMCLVLGYEIDGRRTLYVQ